MPARVALLAASIAFVALAALGGARAATAVDANVADEAALQTINGIGPALATRILEARQQGGPFRDLEDLRGRVRGVGPANLKKMTAGGLSVGGAAGGVAAASVPAGAGSGAGAGSAAAGQACAAPAAPIELIVGNAGGRRGARK